MVNRILISFSAVQMYEIPYIHFYGISLGNTNTTLFLKVVFQLYSKGVLFFKPVAFNLMHESNKQTFICHYLKRSHETREEGEENLEEKHDGLHFGLKYARIFVLGNFQVFLESHSFSRATLSENCSLLGTDNVRVQI